MINSLRKVYLRFILLISSSIAYSETPLEAPNIVITEMTSGGKLINEGLGEVRVRRSVAVVSSINIKIEGFEWGKLEIR